MTSTAPITPLKILHISDLHFGRFHLPAVAAELLILAEQLQPSVIVVSGDLTQRAKTEEFVDAAKFLQKLELIAPLLVVPGNHDIPLYRVWERLFVPRMKYKSLIEPHFSADFIRRDVMILGLDSTIARMGLVRGGIKEAALKALMEKVNRQPHSPALRIAVVHHPVLPDKRTPRGKFYLRNSVKFLSLIKSLGFNFVLSGHLHESRLYQPVEAKDIHCLISGTSTSSRGRHAEKGVCSCFVLEFQNDAFSVQRYLSSLSPNPTFEPQEPTFIRMPFPLG